MIKSLKNILKNKPFIWQWYSNRSSSWKFIFYKIKLDTTSRSVVESLRKNGIANAKVKDLLPDNLWDELSALRFEHDEKNVSDKTYAFFHLDRTYDKDSIYARIAEHETIKNIAMAYFKMDKPQLAYYDIWENMASGELPKNAQLWHKDRDDLKILKIFIYLSDVGENNGPFSYAPQTHIEGKVKEKPEFILENGKVERSNDEQMNKIVSKEKWITTIGEKGTIVFADTHGYHKGGYVLENKRLLFVSMYLSPSSGRNRFENK